MDTDPKKETNSYLKYSSLGIQMLISIGVCGWLGYLLDNYLELTFPAFMIGFGFAAFGVTLYQLYRSISSN